jgi:hypothetical protein
MIKILLILAVLLISSCKSAGELTVCISDPARGGLWCSKDGAPKYLLDFQKSENYICMPSDDARTLFERLKTCEDF